MLVCPTLSLSYPPKCYWLILICSCLFVFEINKIQYYIFHEHTGQQEKTTYKEKLAKISPLTNSLNYEPIAVLILVLGVWWCTQADYKCLPFLLRSLVATNDHLLQELEEAKQRHLLEISQMNTNYQQLRKTVQLCH